MSSYNLSIEFVVVRHVLSSKRGKPEMNIRLLTVWNGDVRFWSDRKTKFVMLISTYQSKIMKIAFIASIFYIVKVKSTEKCYQNQILDELSKKCIGKYIIIDFANERMCALIMTS